MQLDFTSHKILIRYYRVLSFTGIFLLGLCFMSFANEENVRDTSRTNDSTIIQDKGFKSLFSTGVIDAAQPLLTQLNPLAVPYVKEYVQQYGKKLNNMKEWGQAYFNLFDGILTKYGVPKELKYLAVIESDLRATATSRVGAAGPWQFMSSLARDYGLKVTKRVDERRDYVKSTTAAARHLRDLYNQFGDWLLVIAAYNGGANRVERLLKKTGKDDFWSIQYMLPAETRNHVKKFIGTHFVFEGGGGITTMTGSEITDYKEAVAQNAVLKNASNFPNTDVIEVSGRYNASIIMKALSMDVNEFNKLNPGFDRALSSGSSYSLRLPTEKISEFQQKKQEILQQSVQALLTSAAF
jgi:membrane-bound lytic murein transglycosylase D